MSKLLLLAFAFVFLLSFIKLFSSIKALQNINDIKEHFVSGSVEFFYTKDCGLCPIAREKLLKRMGKNVGLSDRNLTRIKKKRTVCGGSPSVCIEEEYEDYENEADGKRAESLSIHWTSVPVAVISASNIIVIMYLTHDNINRL